MKNSSKNPEHDEIGVVHIRKKEICELIGNRIQKERKKKRLTQQLLAERIESSKNISVK